MFNDLNRLTEGQFCGYFSRHNRSNNLSCHEAFGSYLMFDIYHRFFWFLVDPERKQNLGTGESIIVGCKDEMCMCILWFQPRLWLPPFETAQKFSPLLLISPVSRYLAFFGENMYQSTSYENT